MDVIMARLWLRKLRWRGGPCRAGPQRLCAVRMWGPTGGVMMVALTQHPPGAIWVTTSWPVLVRQPPFGIKAVWA
jgi:hypothetical protein